MPITTLPLDHLLQSTDHVDFSGRRALSDVSVAIAKARRVVVVSGAGISCSSGIPVCPISSEFKQDEMTRIGANWVRTFAQKTDYTRW